jgi:hypothetical protein
MRQPGNRYIAAMKKKPEQATKHGIVGPDGKPFEIPEKGSIGLLALGYRGLMAWREKRIEAGKKKLKG